MKTEFKSIFELLEKFHDEQSCIDHLEALRWDGKVISPFDKDSQVYKCKNNKYKCRNTSKYFNVKTNTIFEDTKISLQKWFMALYEFSSHKKGISSHQLAKDIDVTQKTAWFLLHRLRYAFDHPDFKETLKDDVEIDETFIGGKNKNRHKDKKVQNSQGRSFKDKTPVLGMIERQKYTIIKRPHKIIKGEIVSEKIISKESKLICEVVPDTKQQTVDPIVKLNIQAGTNVYTDEWDAYSGLKSTYNHSMVNHGAKQYVNGMAHTNNMECFWSHLKRGINGIYHWVSEEHLQSYANEFTLRFNTRHDTTNQRFDLILGNVIGRLTYKQLISDEKTN